MYIIKCKSFSTDAPFSRGRINSLPDCFNLPMRTNNIACYKDSNKSVSTIVECAGLLSQHN